MVPDRTHCVRSARRAPLFRARVDAALVEAHAVRRTVDVVRALGPLTFFERIAVEAGRALARGAVIVTVAFGRRCARIV